MNKKSKLRFPRILLYFFLSLLILVLLVYVFIVYSSLSGRETITVDNLERHYRVYVPDAYTEEKPTALVLVFHMLTASGKTAEWLTHFNKLADQEGFIVVYPEGYKASWAEGSQLYAADQANVNDVYFISTLIDQLSTQYTLDSQRIYATGFSSGGLMVQRLACELSDKITAIATVGATLTENSFKNCQPQEPLPVLMINGNDDMGVPWQGTPDYVPIPEAAAFWATQNGCKNTPETDRMPDQIEDGTLVEKDVYQDCSTKKPVILYRVLGGGHTWPGGNQAVQLWGLNGKINQDIDASWEIWSFFSNQ